MTDVATVLHAIELDLAHHLVGALLGLAHVVGQGGHAQHPPATGEHIVAFAPGERRCDVEPDRTEARIAL